MKGFHLYHWPDKTALLLFMQPPTLNLKSCYLRWASTPFLKIFCEHLFRSIFSKLSQQSLQRNSMSALIYFVWDCPDISWWKVGSWHKSGICLWAKKAHFNLFSSTWCQKKLLMMSIFECTCNDAIHNVWQAHTVILFVWYPHHATVVPTCVPPVTMRHSLAKPQASGMHVALDRLPAPDLAAPRHHAPNAVTATGPCPSPRASTTPAVAGPRRGSSTALPTLIHGPTGRNSGVDRRQRNTDRQKETTRRGYKEEKERDGQTRDRRTDVQSRRAKELSVKIVNRWVRHFVSSQSSHKCLVLYTANTLSSCCRSARQSVNKTALKRYGLRFTV